jgi:O-antigen ligase
VQSAAPGIAVGLFKIRNFLFFVAVLSMHMIVLRPTPADGLFMVVLYLSVVLNPTINAKALIFFLLTLVWTVCIYLSSIHVMNDPEVQFQLLSRTFVVLLGLTGCVVAMSWRESNFHSFTKVYLAACCIAAILGIVGFVGGVDVFIWDGRAKALFPEPNVLGGFLLPGVLAATYLLNRGHGLVFPLVALVLCIVGVVLSFSRVAIFSLVVFAPIYFIVLSRDHRARAIAHLLIVVAIVVAVLTVALMSFNGFEAKVFDRSTIAKDYDVGPKGRYSRYLLSIPIILENPLGLGLLEVDKYFPEPIHNLYIGSFLDYGWIAGVVMLLLTALAFKIAFENERATRSPISMWLGFSLLTQLPCALLQQVEHWRHLWMFLGLLWGFNIRNFPAVVTARNRTQMDAPAQLRMGRSYGMIPKSGNRFSEKIMVASSKRFRS